MRVVHVNSDAGRTGGASIAVCRLHKMFSDMGVDSIIVCRHQPMEPGSVLVHRGIVWSFLLFCWRVFMKIYAGTCYPTGLISTGLARRINKYKPDLVILHWLQNDTMSVEEIMRLKAPVLWFHHDLWPVLGLMSYPYFAVPRRSLFVDRMSRWNKRRVMRRMGVNMTPICASDWCASEIVKYGHYLRNPRIVPLPVDSCFTHGPRRRHEKFRILSGAFGGFQMGIKGGDRLLEALKMISDDEWCDMEVVVFGAGDGEKKFDGITIRFIGRLTGDKLAQEYRDADVFAFPSRQETFGQTKFEALSCGTPVVVFDESACSAGVIHLVNGWVASADDIAGFAAGLNYYHAAWRQGRPIRVSPSPDYSPEIVAQKWMDLLKSLCNNVESI